MDPENLGKEAILRVTDWLRGIWEMKRRGGPIQQWVDSIPSPTKSTIDIQIDCGNDSPTPPSTPDHSKNLDYSSTVMTLSTPMSMPNSPAITMTSVPSRLARDPSLQSDSSHCSSVESLLELRRADPEAILLGLGFGGCPKASQDNGPLSRIPKRFLQPSKLKGITLNDFVKQQQETTESIDSASLGYRGLTGSPYVAPSEIVQKIMERLREHEGHEFDAYTAYNSETCSTMPMYESRPSELSPDSRQYDRQRSKSPDMRNKRMIIGKKSFTFSCDGDLIEINAPANADYPTESLSDTYQECQIVPETVNSSPNSEPSSIGKQTGSPGDNSIDVADDIHTHDAPDVIKTSVSPVDIPRNNNNYYRGKFDSADDGTLSSCSPRRASDSSCDIKPIHTMRRYSDGIIKMNSDKSRRKRQGRRGLRRQARISESDNANCCDSECSDSVLIEKFDDIDSPSDSKTNQATSGDSHVESKPTNIKRQTFCDPKRHHLCCKSETMEQVCRHEEDCKECCYHKSTISCWRKMRKIMEKNEKLENMVVKSRQEMAEIREMLNSVLSVRMEPGF